MVNRFARSRISVLGPAFLGLVGGVAVCVTAGWTWSNGVIAAILTIAGIALTRAWIVTQEQSPEAVANYFSSRSAFGDAIVPVWTGQIASSVSQMESAVAELTVRFAGIVDKLEQTVQAANRAGEQSVDDRDHGLMAVFASSETQLASVVSSLKSAMNSKAAMLDKVQHLEQFIDELKDMADNVKTNAAQTNLLALNAAIEAARAGEHGKGFAMAAAQEIGEVTTSSVDLSRAVAGRNGAEHPQDLGPGAGNYRRLGGTIVRGGADQCRDGAVESDTKTPVRKPDEGRAPRKNASAPDAALDEAHFARF